MLFYSLPCVRLTCLSHKAIRRHCRRRLLDETCCRCFLAPAATWPRSPQGRLGSFYAGFFPKYDRESLLPLHTFRILQRRTAFVLAS